MILLNDILRVALVTGHIPLSEVPSRITKSDIVQKLRIFNHCLKQDFGIVKPRIAVLSLNPHAGEDGLLGNEEKEIFFVSGLMQLMVSLVQVIFLSSMVFWLCTMTKGLLRLRL